MTTLKRFDSGFLKRATGGTVVADPGGDRVVTDSRIPVAGALFVALAGPHFDGHAYVRAALEAGATGAVVGRSWWEAEGTPDLPLVVVTDTLDALQRMSGAHRARHDLAVVAITGSNGKTSTKELTAAALAPLGPVLRTRGNLNNHIGLPMTLLEIEAGHRAAVVEIGLNHPGEMAVLSPLARPRVAVITNIAAAHLEGLGSVDGVARAKAEIAVGLEPEGILVVPTGFPELDRALAVYPNPRITFGLDDDADLHPRSVLSRGPEGMTVTLPDGTVLETALPGEHAVRNLLAATAVARALGIPAGEAAAGLAAVRPTPGRLCPRKAGSVLLLDDTYNANPASLRAALAVLRGSPAERRWAVLGDMLELGPDAAALHAEAGRAATFLDGLVVVGPLAAHLAEGARAGGLPAERVHRAEDGAAAGTWLAPRLQPGDVVLVKGSRGMRLETTVAALIAALEDED